MRRNWREKQLKKYRLDKHRPRRAKITIEEDAGDRLIREIITTPRFDREEAIIPKKSTGQWTIIYRGNGIKILRSKRHDRTYMFLENGDYVGELDEIDQAKLGVRILQNLDAFREEVHWRHGSKTYYKIVLNLKKVLGAKLGPKHG